MPAFAKGYEAYHLSVTTIHLECPDSDPPDRSVAADVLFRQEPDEEEDEEEDAGDGKGGEGGIRTLDTDVSPYNGLAN